MRDTGSTDAWLAAELNFRVTFGISSRNLVAAVAATTTTAGV